MTSTDQQILVQRLCYYPYFMGALGIRRSPTTVRFNFWSFNNHSLYNHSLFRFKIIPTTVSPQNFNKLADAFELGQTPKPCKKL